MKILLSLLFFTFAGIFAACIQKDGDIKVVKTECWTDMMPGSGGKTFLQITAKIQGINKQKTSIVGVTIIWGAEKYDLQNGEFESRDILSEDTCTVALLAGFRLPGKDIPYISALLDFRVGTEQFKHTINSIKVEKVY